jgi:hypothetical protein
MNMNNKIIALALTSIFSTSLLAADATYQATVVALNEPTLTNSAALHFGSIAPTVGSSCSMDTTGTVTGDCELTDVNILIGEVTLTDLIAATDLTVTVSGSVGADLTFAAVWDINSAGSGNADGIADAVATNISVDGAATTIELDIYGDLSVNSALTGGDTYTADYTVNVVFQ